MRAACRPPALSPCEGLARGKRGPGGRPAGRRRRPGPPAAGVRGLAAAAVRVGVRSGPGLRRLRPADAQATPDLGGRVQWPEGLAENAWDALGFRS